MSYTTLCHTYTQDPGPQHLCSDELTFSLNDATCQTRIPVLLALITGVPAPSILQQPNITLTPISIETNTPFGTNNETCAQFISCEQNGTQGTYNWPYWIDSNSTDNSDDDHSYYLNNNTQTTSILITTDTTAKHNNFGGCCLDSGSSLTLVGQLQFEAYQSYLEHNTKLTQSSHSFLFATGVHKRSGSFMARLPIPVNSFLCSKTYNVPIYVPFLIGMYVLKQFRPIIDLPTQLLTSQTQNWKLPLFYKHGHLYIQHTLEKFTTC